MTLWVAAALAIAIASGWLTHRFDEASYAHLEAKFSDYRSKVSIEAEEADQAALKAIQAQQEEAAAQARHANDVIQSYQDELEKASASVAGYRAAFERLRNAALNSHPGRDPVPQAGDLPGADDPAANLCARIAQEDEFNAAQLKALQDEVRPLL